MSKFYGYARCSTKTQKINRQVTNISKSFREAIIYKEYFSGTTQKRPQWKQLLKILQPGNTLIFDSVSRMSRSAIDGYEDYKMLYEKGVKLIFLKEPLINSSVLDESTKRIIDIQFSTKNEAIDKYFSGNIKLINELLLELTKEQIKEAFKQSQQEVDTLKQRIKEGHAESRKNGILPGLKKGRKLVTKASKRIKEVILNHSKNFNGNLKDSETIKLCECARNTYYKYKKLLLTEGSNIS